MGHEDGDSPVEGDENRSERCEQSGDTALFLAASMVT